MRGRLTKRAREVSRKMETEATPARSSDTRRVTQPLAPREEQGERGEAWVRLSEELEARVMLVTPDLATRWLEHNHGDNRTIAWRAVDAHANDMAAGHWVLTHQAIAFSSDGTLIDGQHRLNAVRRSGASVRMLVIRNREGAISDPIDRGRTRTLGVLLNQDNKLVASMNVLRQLEAGSIISVPMTLAEAGELFKAHEAQLDQLRAVAGQYHMIGALRAAALYALPVDPDRVLNFVHKVNTGEMLERGNPAWAFRNWRERNARADSWSIAMAALNCIRYYVLGEPIAMVYTGESGYRAITTRRRVQRIPNTPAESMVNTMRFEIDKDREHGDPDRERHPEPPPPPPERRPREPKPAPGVDPFAALRGGGHG